MKQEIILGNHPARAIEYLGRTGLLKKKMTIDEVRSIIEPLMRNPAILDREDYWAEAQEYAMDDYKCIIE